MTFKQYNLWVLSFGLYGGLQGQFNQSNKLQNGQPKSQYCASNTCTNLNFFYSLDGLLQ